MALRKWLLIVWRWFVTRLHIPARNEIPKPTSEKSCESDLEKLRKQIKELGVYDLHDVLRRQNRVEWCEWHLNIDKNDNAIKIAEEFHKDFQKLKLSSSIAAQVDTIEETFLKFMPKTDKNWKEIRNYFEEARKQNNPELIIKAYTSHKLFTEHLNKHSAANTYHGLKLYCTLLNCPILAQTQEYTEAFTKILFHPKLEIFLVRKGTVYRGMSLTNKKLVDNYTEGATIITTTLLSTSTDPEVAEFFLASAPEDAIKVFCTYNINNTYRHTALDLKNLSVYRNEKEILILRHAPFTIKSVERMDDGRRMTICFDECKEECIV
jgi:hypothetical protein